MKEMVFSPLLHSSGQLPTGPYPDYILNIQFMVYGKIGIETTTQTPSNGLPLLQHGKEHYYLQWYQDRYLHREIQSKNSLPVGKAEEAEIWREPSCGSC